MSKNKKRPTYDEVYERRVMKIKGKHRERGKPLPIPKKGLTLEELLLINERGSV